MPVTVVTQVEVNPDDPAFANPTKPIGSIMSRGTAESRSDAYGWTVVEEVGHGWRRVVPCPEPKRIVEAGAVRFLMDNGYVVIAAGGGGIPVAADENGDLRGVAAVVDKDLASAMLAHDIGADTLIISTNVDQVALNWGTKSPQPVAEMRLDEVRGRLAEGVHFAAGTMEPKMQAVVRFLEAGGQMAVITSPDSIESAMAGESGTRITP
jgi:carbamate kinase